MGYMSDKAKTILEALGLAVTIVGLVFAYLQLREGNSGTSPKTENGDLLSTPIPSSTEGSGSTPTMSIPAQSPPRLPYQADWSRGMGGWVGSEDWTTVNGMLVNNGGRDSQQISITAPISLDAVRDYVVEADIQLVKYSDEGSTSALNSFGLIVRSGDNNSGYGVGHCVSVRGLTFVPEECAPNQPEVGAANSSPGDVAPPPAFVTLIQTADDQDREVIKVAPFRPRDSWHHYRAEVKGNTIRLLIDGTEILTATDNRYLTGGRIGLWSKHCQINIKSFRITAA